MAKIDLQIETQIARLTIDNPGKLNVLTMGMLDQLETHLEQIDNDEQIRVLILDAKPARAFCAGADIKEWSEMSGRDFSKIWVRKGHRIFDRLARLSMPTLAVIDAPVMGGGLELAACTDWRILGQNAVLSLPETSIGIIPGWSGTQRLGRLLPEAALKAMVLFGETLEAAQAAQFGFGEFAQNPTERAEELCALCCKRSPEANRLSKMMINAANGEDQAAMIEALGGGMAAGSEDMALGVAAFKAKQKPKF